MNSDMTASQIAAIRAEFPLIAKHDRVYFDNAATSQKPACVLQATEQLSHPMHFVMSTRTAISFPPCQAVADFAIGALGGVFGACCVSASKIFSL